MMAPMSCGISCDRSMMRGVNIVLVPRVNVGSCSSSKAVVEIAALLVLCSSCIGLVICIKHIFVYRADMLRARRPWEAVKQAALSESKYLQR